MNIHLIAIGGSAMHNMALAMHQKGFNVSGSDDEIREPSYTRLKNAGILPESIGWFPEKITKNLDAVILGMHAREDNPELIKAKELGIKIYSYPEYIYEQTKDKTRIVIGGSHGKTTITAMILHVLNKCGVDTDYMVGAQLTGFDTMVRLTKEAKYAVIEGDEYLSSPIDRRPKFHLYKPNIAIISGIAWDHMNVFPTFDNYIDQFRKFIQLIEPNGTLIYCELDPELKKIASEITGNFEKIAYQIPENSIQNGITTILLNGIHQELQVFGEHNLMNLMAAYQACNKIGITTQQFLTAIGSFNGAAKRLELIARNKTAAAFKDFAHSPSKLKATIKAVCDQFPQHYKLCSVELHTFSSLNKEFIKQYEGCSEGADQLMVYFNPKVIEHKKLPPISAEEVKDSFQANNVEVYTDALKWKNSIIEKCNQLKQKNSNFVALLMSSGNYDGINLDQLGTDLVN